MPLDISSLIVSLLGLALSVWALRKAKTAKEIATRAIDAKNTQEDNKRINNVINKLNDAKKASMRNVSSANTDKKSGLPRNKDIEILVTAVDSLRTALPLSWDQSKRAPAGKASFSIERAIQEIKSQSSQRDGWQDALSSLQTIIPWLEQQERQSGEHSLRNPIH